jgi:hypothetical protein
VNLLNSNKGVIMDDVELDVSELIDDENDEIIIDSSDDLEDEDEEDNEEEDLDEEDEEVTPALVVAPEIIRRKKRRDYQPTGKFNLPPDSSIKVLDQYLIPILGPTNWTKYWRNELYGSPKRSQYNVVYK